MRHITLTRAGFGAALAVGLALGGPALAYTQDQAAAGKTAYDSYCAQCHGVRLEGPEAPGLAGADVMSNWATPGGIYDFISVAMPPTGAGQLGEQTYVDIVAYIMQFNGAPADDTPLALGDEMASISLPEVTAAGAATSAAALDAGGGSASDTGADTNVPQAFTWGKQLPGGLAPAPAAPTATSAAAPSVPQAYTWGKTLPSTN